VRIGAPARKHGVTDVDMCTRSAPRCAAWSDDELAMLIGPAGDGALLEVGVLDIDGEDPVLVHAMALRPMFYRFLR
jgi:hypothetical protein